MSKAANIWSWWGVAFLLGVFFCGIAHASTLDAVAHPNAPAQGNAKVDFAAGTIISPFEPFEVTSYEGAWTNGRADGEGLLKFQNTTDYVPRQNYYIGRFRNGVPNGDGVLVISSGSFEQRITGLYTDASATFSIDGQEIAVITKANGKVLVRLMQYVGFGSTKPSRMYLGEAAQDGQVTGQWIDVPWYSENKDEFVAGYGKYLEIGRKDGSGVSCEFPERQPDPGALVPDLMSQHATNPIGAQRIASLDTQYRTGVASCVSRNPKGWTWYYTINYGPAPPSVQYIECKTPNGRSARLDDGGTSCKTKKKKKQDPFTNVGQEIKRFVDNTIIGNIDRAGGAVERSMCRATGTEPGRNCHVNVQVGASWPVGDGPASGLSAEEQAIRTNYIAAKTRAQNVPGTLAGTALGDATALAADLNAICSGLCATAAQRRYSDNLLSELEAVANQPMTDETVSKVANVNRETASVFGAGLRATAIILPVVTVGVPFYKFINSNSQTNRIDLAIETVGPMPQNVTFEYLTRRTKTLAALQRLRMAHMERMAGEGSQVLGAAITQNIRFLSNYPPQKITTLVAIITVGKSEEEVRAFIEKHKDITSESELYDALIRDALAPLGVGWP